MRKAFAIILFLLAISKIDSQEKRFIYEVFHTIGDKTYSSTFNLDIYKSDSYFYESALLDNPKLANTDLIIRKNRDSISLYDHYDNHFFYATAEYKPIWEITNETKTIERYKVQKAKITSKNKVWFAWFTVDISINDGPYKFSGLPGMIIEIQDEKKEYTFILREISNLTQSENIFDFKKYELVPNNVYLKLRKNKDNLINMLNNNVFGGNTIMSDKGKQILNNAVETEKYKNVLYGLE